MGLAGSPRRKTLTKFQANFDAEVQKLLTRPPKKTKGVSSRLYPVDKIATKAALTRNFHRGVQIASASVDN